MLKYSLIFSGLIVSFGIGFLVQSFTFKESDNFGKVTKGDENGVGSIGAFSMSLAVKDLKISKAFYENLGFTVFGGSEKRDYLIMKNGKALIGLFQGMFEGNILTFNPGWDENAKNLENYEDIRSIQSKLLQLGVVLDTKADSTTTGPASFFLKDPDGNSILLDQHR